VIPVKRVKLSLLDPATGEPRDYWLSTPTPYILELMIDNGVVLGRRRDVVDVDAILAAVPATDKALAAMTPAARKLATSTRKTLLAEKARVGAMTPEELAAARKDAADAPRARIPEIHATLAAFLTAQEPEDDSGMPSRVWSRKQAADVIPWESYQTVAGVLDDLMRDATSGVPSGEAPAESASL
jgi:hypothetical protein